MSGPTWGTPWHGLVNGGQVALPNGTTRPYPGVVESNPAPNIGSGRTHRVKRPDWQMPPRSAEDAIADQLAGKEWRDEAMLSGINQALYGKDLKGWIYFAPDGSRWHIEHTSTSAVGSMIMRLSLRPFGRLGEAPPWVIRDLTVDPLQSPALFVGAAAFTVGVRGNNSFTTEPSPGVFLWDISSSGKRAVFRVSLQRTTFWPGEAAPHLAVGWLEVTVSGGDANTPPNTTLAVLYSRAQTLGVAAEPDVSGLEVAELGVSFETVETPDEAPPPSVVAQYPTSAGYSYVVLTTTMVPQIGPGPATPAKARGASNFSGSLANRVAGRVFAVWYDENEQPQPVTLDVEWGASVVDEHTAVPSGESVIKFVRGPEGGQGFVYFSTSNSKVEAEMVTHTTGYLECRLSHGSHVVTQRTECRETQRQGVRYDSAGWTYQPLAVSAELDAPGETFTGAYTSTPRAQIEFPSLSPLPVAIPTGVDARFWAPWADWAGWLFISGTVNVWGQRRQAPPTDVNVQGAFALRLIPITPHIAGWIAYGGARSVGGASWQVHHREVLTPSGVDDRTYATSYGSFGASGWHLHASRDPMTGECARFYPARVCYV